MGHMEESSNFHSKLAYFEILDKDTQEKMSRSSIPE